MSAGRLTDGQLDALLRYYLGSEGGDLNLGTPGDGGDGGSVTIVSDVAAAQQLAVDLRSERALAVDCEASGGMHRFGRLCLLQIGTLDGRCYLIDPVVFNKTNQSIDQNTDQNADQSSDQVIGTDQSSCDQAVEKNPDQVSEKREICRLGAELVAPLRPLLEDASVLKVMHDCRGDSDLLFHAYGVRLCNVVDTQIAYAMQQQLDAGSTPLPVSLRTLHVKHGFAAAAEVKDLARDEMTDSYWLQRPMTPLMISYAAADVQYLVRVYNSLAATFSPDSLPVLTAYSDRYVAQYRDLDHDQRCRTIDAEAQRDPAVRFVPVYGIDDWDQLAARLLRPDRPSAARPIVAKRDVRDSVVEPSPRTKFTRFLYTSACLLQG